ncbi:hypothetical protein UFOVP968_17 [uncultured Caudovirales phage]|uniref:Uncharacterized protein n=1 Tax=uncultured Caudovirales phage TaxID=2100421 RepID=A0A6J5PQJ8_9CAUD|nr:hypothetical protein UFOVP968_17 [uncultured Caudovirales phage]CAB4186057.1 hypothetical protein UFOVP1133_11 [uncultured Caudovirales phage]CAB4192316.1 hypothetical protein UFOVP1249_14 [uncultured Caudovirales phage]CAB4217269.1 hypothetical protein UFOVP1494_20 [uncultured Caudovirales phage]CAB5231013.1 hypothetical protein UFOVP1583_14 [uncultured Caudovirales phage]
MAGATYTPIASTTTSGSASTVTLSSISGAYTDLIVVVNYDSATAGNQSLNMRFNGDTATNYSYTILRGSGSAAQSANSGGADNRIYCGSSSTGTTNIASNAIIQIQNYSNTTTYKTALIRNNNPDYYLFANVGLWRSTAAITSITLYQSSYNFINGSTFTLYGIAAA